MIFSSTGSISHLLSSGCFIPVTFQMQLGLKQSNAVYHEGDRFVIYIIARATQADVLERLKPIEAHFLRLTVAICLQRNLVFLLASRLWTLSAKIADFLQTLCTALHMLGSSQNVVLFVCRWAKRAGWGCSSLGSKASTATYRIKFHFSTLLRRELEPQTVLPLLSNMWEIHTSQYLKK